MTQHTATIPTVATGKYFHTIEDGSISRQGIVLSESEPGQFIVEIHEWLTGQASGEYLVLESNMDSWRFYSSAEAMCAACESECASKGLKPYFN
jgi:hypothetical protein